MPVKEYSELRLFDLHAMRSHEIVPKLKNHTKKVGDAKLPDMTPEERDEKEKKREKQLFGNVRGERVVFARELWPKLVISYYIQVYCKGCGET